MTCYDPSTPQAKRQHYVPQLLLKHFCAQNSNRLWVFDKHTDKVWRQAIDQIGHERYFNEVSLGDGWVVSYENKFQYIENEFAPILAKVNRGATLPSLSPIEGATLCFFVALQHLRTPAFLSKTREMKGIFRSLFPGGDIPQSITQQFGSLAEASDKKDSLALVFSLADESAKTLTQKTWFLHETHPSRSFYISDTPVVLHNDSKDEFFCTLGLSVIGIEIYMPISASTLLGAYCPTVVKPMMEIEPFRTALQTGSPIPCELPNMDFYNFLQVANAERFVYCREDDFDLVRDILNTRPDLRKPRRFDSPIIQP